MTRKLNSSCVPRLFDLSVAIHAAMSNATDALKALVREHGGKGTIGPSVNENGGIETFR